MKRDSTIALENKWSKNYDLRGHIVGVGWGDFSRWAHFTAAVTHNAFQCTPTMTHLEWDPHLINGSWAQPSHSPKLRLDLFIQTDHATPFVAIGRICHCSDVASKLNYLRTHCIFTCCMSMNMLSR